MQNAVGCWRNCRGTTREREQRAGGEANFATIRFGDNRGPGATQGDCADPVPVAAIGSCDGLRREGERQVRRRRREDGIRQSKKVSKGLGFFACRSFQNGEAFAKFRDTHQRVAEECRSCRGGARIWAGSSGLQGRELLLNLGGPGGGVLADFGDCGLKYGGVAAFCSDAAQLQEGGQVVGLRGQDFLDQILEVGVGVRAALAFDLFRQVVCGAIVPWIDLGCFPPVGDGFGGMAPAALQGAE